MKELSVEDYSRVLRAIEVLSSADDNEGFPERALAAVFAAIDVDFASFGEVDLRTGYNRYVVRPDPGEQSTAPDQLERHVRRFGNHPILAHRLSAGAPQYPGLEGFLSRLRLMGMVGNCCGEAGLALNLGLTLKNSDRRLVGITIHRGYRDFDAHDAAVLSAVKPHLRSAFRVANRLASAHAPPDSGAVVSGVPLTTRENEVLYWVAMGKTNGEVGTIIGARPLTVKKHLERIYDKLGVPNRTAAARAYRTAAI